VCCNLIFYLTERGSACAPQTNDNAIRRILSRDGRADVEKWRFEESKEFEELAAMTKTLCERAKHVTDSVQAKQVTDSVEDVSLFDRTDVISAIKSQRERYCDCHNPKTCKSQTKLTLAGQYIRAYIGGVAQRAEAKQATDSLEDVPLFGQLCIQGYCWPLGNQHHEQPAYADVLRRQPAYADVLSQIHMVPSTITSRLQLAQSPRR
jgi:hypothetical protein